MKPIHRHAQCRTSQPTFVHPFSAGHVKLEAHFTWQWFSLQIVAKAYKQSCTCSGMYFNKQTNMQKSKEGITFPPWYRKKTLHINFPQTLTFDSKTQVME